ncbi:MAG: hypothetical protein GC136_06725 [Alphaproteobacteria bacterium]|nr:hypothetical protein [Alphaproteobacteria bacterium]
MRSLLAKIADARFFFLLAPALMALLVIGTLAQQNAGIYEVQQTYFHSWIFFLFGVVPFPGGFTLIGLTALSLFIKTIFFSEWKWQKAGIIITHMGVLLLLLGGMVTTLIMREGFVLLREGAEKNYYESYTERQLVIRSPDVTPANAGVQYFKMDASFRWHDMGDIKVASTCRNINIITRDEQEVDNPWGMAKFMALECAPPAKEEEANIAGLTFMQGGKTYIAFDGMKNVPQLDDGRIVSVERARTNIPFNIRLDKFIHENHPGTTIPVRFTSNLSLREGEIVWPAVTDMNKPLRYKGYTIFQSSFAEDADGTKASILSVVENKGRLLPYIATLIICIGLLLHLYILRGKP